MSDGLKAQHRTAIIATLAANNRVEQAVLFGSRAMGTNTVTSDVDIALFGQHLTTAWMQPEMLIPFGGLLVAFGGLLLATCQRLSRTSGRHQRGAELPSPSQVRQVRLKPKRQPVLIRGRSSRLHATPVSHPSAHPPARPD